MGYEERRCLANCPCNVSKISNLRGPDPPTLQTDGQTDDMESQYRSLHYSASRGNQVVVKILRKILSIFDFTTLKRVADTLYYSVLCKTLLKSLKTVAMNTKIYNCIVPFEAWF